MEQSWKEANDATPARIRLSDSRLPLLQGLKADNEYSQDLRAQTLGAFGDGACAGGALLIGED
jgi:hypothetical protein